MGRGGPGTLPGRQMVFGLSCFAISSLLNGRDHLLSSVQDVVGGSERHSAFGESLLASLDVVALEPNDERNADMGFAGSFDRGQ